MYSTISALSSLLLQPQHDLGLDEIKAMLRTWAGRRPMRLHGFKVQDCVNGVAVNEP